MFKKIISFSIVLWAMSSISLAAETASLEVSISGVKSEQGSVMVSVFNDSDPKAFPNDIDKAVVKLKLSVAESAKFMIEGLPPGDYALAIFHDENDNGKLDTGSMGIPKEGFGFSNDAMGTFGPPSFQKAKISVAAPVTQTSIKMKHM